MRSITKRYRDVASPILSLVCAGLFAFSLGGCAEGYYTEANPTPESRYNTYHAPDYYPYYPWYSYYGGAYYSEY
ncbi:MAG TPA: hypothetical protein VGH06_02170 [Candidatus Udaeobacter sp.]